MVNGDTLNTFSVQYQNPDGTLFNFTGYTASLAIRDIQKTLIIEVNSTEPNGNSSGITINNTTATIYPVITPADTVLFPVGTFKFDLRISNGTNVQTIYGGTIEVQDSQQ